MADRAGEHHLPAVRVGTGVIVEMDWCEVVVLDDEGELLAIQRLQDETMLPQKCCALGTRLALAVIARRPDRPCTIDRGKSRFRSLSVRITDCALLACMDTTILLQ